MLFNSLHFFVFLPVVFTAYWLINRYNIKYQNLFLVVVSYIFYGWWDPRFLLLIVFSSLIDYTVGWMIGQTRNPFHQRIFLLTSVLVNLGVLGFFKYFNFFADSFAKLLSVLGMQTDFISLNIILPVGISFYTFQTLSYTIDVYRGTILPTRNIVAFFAYVSFFPQLVAGPIERAAQFLPQFLRKRTFRLELACDGTRQMLWGFVKKILVADNCGIVTDQIFSDTSVLNGPTILIGCVLFAFQVYCDFSGYSDIAIGTARLFGFRLTRNFAYPYLARNIQEFWQRWHISLTNWFRDYVFLPLGGSLDKPLWLIVNNLITFALVGLWHGASWNFVVFGIVNGLYFIPSLVIFRKHRSVQNQDETVLHILLDVLRQIRTFVAMFLPMLLFRVPTIPELLMLFKRIAATDYIGAPLPSANFSLLLCFGMFSMEFLQRRHPHGLEISHYPQWFRWSLYISLTWLIITFGAFHQRQFIYFQF